MNKNEIKIHNLFGMGGYLKPIYELPLGRNDTVLIVDPKREPMELKRPLKLLIQ